MIESKRTRIKKLEQRKGGGIVLFVVKGDYDRSRYPAFDGQTGECYRMHTWVEEDGTHCQRIEDVQTPPEEIQALRDQGYMVVVMDEVMAHL